MKTTKLGLIFDFIFGTLFVFVVVFVWARYFLHNMVLSLLLSAVITFCVCGLYYFVSKKKKQEILMSKTELKLAHDISTYFLLCTKAETTKEFVKMLSGNCKTDALNKHLKTKNKSLEIDTSKKPSKFQNNNLSLENANKTLKEQNNALKIADKEQSITENGTLKIVDKEPLKAQNKTFKITAKEPLKVQNNKPSIETKSDMILINNVAIRPIYTTTEITDKDVLESYAKIKNTSTKKLILCCQSYSPKASEIASVITEKNIVIFSEYDAYKNIFKPCEFVAPTLFEQSKEKKNKLKNYLKIAFNKKRTKSYLSVSVILLFSSFILRYNIYYLVFATITTAFALYSHFNTKFNETEKENLYF
jgi:hypothetical protein